MTVRGFRLFFLFVLDYGNQHMGVFFTALNNGFVSAAISFLRTFCFQVAAGMFPSSDYRYRRSVDVRFGCRNDGFGGDNYIFNKGEEKYRY